MTGRIGIFCRICIIDTPPSVLKSTVKVLQDCRHEHRALTYLTLTFAPFSANLSIMLSEYVAHLLAGWVVAVNNCVQADSCMVGLANWGWDISPDHLNACQITARDADDGNWSVDDYCLCCVTASYRAQNVTDRCADCCDLTLQWRHFVWQYALLFIHTVSRDVSWLAAVTFCGDTGSTRFS